MRLPNEVLTPHSALTHRRPTMQPRQVFRHTRKPTRIMIVKMWLNGVPAREIARKFGKSSTTVYKWIRRFRHEGSVDTWQRKMGKGSRKDSDGDSTTLMSSSKFLKFGCGSETNPRTSSGCPDLRIFSPQQNDSTGLSLLHHRRFIADVKTASDPSDYIMASYNQQLLPFYPNNGHDALDSYETKIPFLPPWKLLTIPPNPMTNFIMGVSSCALCMGRKDYGFMSPLSHAQ